MLEERFPQGHAFGGGKRLGIVDAREFGGGRFQDLLRKDHGSGHHGSGEGAATRLIHPRDTRNAALQSGVFVRKQISGRDRPLR